MIFLVDRFASVSQFFSLAAMRTLFVIVGLFGLLLTGLGAFQIRAARNYEAGIRDVQQMLVALDSKAEFEAQKRGGGYLIPSLAYDYGSRLDGFDSFERGWIVVTFTGGALFVLGIIGIILQNRRNQQVSGFKLISKRTTTEFA